ncbi:MAG: hypothetical protein D6702_09280 [Planctomycetota bacterium]|nr:MAG: hypothetical protein D6702_09280 [Planctomycetota bacterium]
MSEAAADPPLRLAVVGARRVRHGTGPFLARHAAAAGAELCAVWGTSADSAGEAAAALSAEIGRDLPAYRDWQRLVAETHPEAVILAGPRPTHAAWLESALRSGLHTLCEKPLAAGRDPAELARDFAVRGLVLAENCQWPFTLAAFHRLHPEIQLDRVDRFSMLLTPAHEGRERWLELLSHPISLLQAVAPGPAELDRIRFHDASRLTFLWLTAGRAISCEVRAEPSAEWPRPAGYALDGALLRRRIEQPGYRISFTDGAGGVVADADPTPLCVAEFLVRARRARARAAAPVDENLVRRQRLFDRILEAWPG